jgi:hypothetical protein
MQSSWHDIHAHLNISDLRPCLICVFKGTLDVLRQCQRARVYLHSANARTKYLSNLCAPTAYYWPYVGTHVMNHPFRGATSRSCCCVSFSVRKRLAPHELHTLRESHAAAERPDAQPLPTCGNVCAKSFTLSSSMSARRAHAGCRHDSARRSS